MTCNVAWDLGAMDSQLLRLAMTSDQPKAASRTPSGNDQFKVLPLSLTSAPATFQLVLSRLIKPRQLTADGSSNASKGNTACAVDASVYNCVWQHCCWTWQTPAGCAHKQGLYLEHVQCVWGQTDLADLDPEASQHELEPVPRKAQPVHAWCPLQCHAGSKVSGPDYIPAQVMLFALVFS